MYPAPFEYLRAESVAHAIALLAEHGDDAKLLAGGHSLLPLMKLRLAQPSVLVDIARIAGLTGVTDGGDHLAIGALTTYAQLERDPLLARHNGLIAVAAHQVGDPQVRHRGTLGGSCAHGDPASDLPTVMVALDATFEIQGPDGARAVTAREFFRGFWETALGPGEILTTIRVPKLADGAAFTYVKLNRRAQDWAIVGVAAIADRVLGKRIAFTNLGATPVRGDAVERALAGGATVAQASEHAADGAAPPEDAHATRDYRAHLARVLSRRALESIAA